MREIKLGNVEFDSNLDNSDPYIIGVFGAEGSGKTRFALTGPEVIGCVPLEMKSYKTITQVCSESGKTVFKPKDPMSLLVPLRKVNALNEQGAREWYKKHVAKVNEVVYGMLEHPDVRIVMIDKFTTYVTWVEFAINGMSGKYIRIKDKVYVDKKESNQEIIDVINSWSQYKKPVVLTNSERAEYINDKDTGRTVWEGFKYLGSHTNLAVHLESNALWKPGSSDAGKSWHFRLNVRKAQGASHLEGPDGNPLLVDDMVSFGELIINIDPTADVESLG